MTDAAIRVEGLGKRYRLGLREPYWSVRDSLSRALSVPFRYDAGAVGARSEDRGEGIRNGFVWALRDVSFEIPRGAVVGVIGSNGAGKSTLLKILSRITEPTEGMAEVAGRVGSLLEVGTGFHPELTGRENILLNGAILGMRRVEIARRLDEIVAFAEVERFIDTPVKRYSSGMYVRLAFAVAAHLDVDILAVDEVLAVGDAAFQQKCLGRMQEVTREQGRTVLFVSHNLGAIRLLSDSCMLLEHGRLAEFGAPNEVVSRYVQTTLRSGSGGLVDLSAATVRRGVQKQVALDVTYESMRLMNDKGETTNVFFEREPIVAELAFRSRVCTGSLELIIAVLSLEGAVIFSSFSGRRYGEIRERVYRVQCRVDPNPLRVGNYRVRLYLRTWEWQDVIPEAAVIHVQPNPSEEDEVSNSVTTPGLLGMVRVESSWGEIRD